MSEAMHKRYWNVMYERPEASEQLRIEYGQWRQVHDAAFDQIHRFFKLTNSLPVVGDTLLLGGANSRDTLRIEERLLFTTEDSETVLLVYHVCSDEIEELEEYREGDLIEENE
jgi:hypothetical protein